MKKSFCFALFVVFLAVSGAFAQETRKLEDVGEWVMHYYLHPAPDEIPRAIEAIASNGYFEHAEAQASLSGFFSEIFRENPRLLDAWIKPYLGVPGRHVFYSALWAADTPEAKTALERMAEASAPEDAKRIQSLLKSKSPDVDSMAINSPAALDYLWGKFFASGSKAPVLRIIDQLKLESTKGNTLATMIGGAANWSLAANARQHERVLDIVKAKVATADPVTRAMLEDILREIEEERAPDGRASGQSGENAAQMAPAVDVGTLDYEIYEISEIDGKEMKLLAAGKKHYSSRDLYVKELRSRGQSHWSKSVALDKGFSIGAQIQREAEISGFGLWVKLSDCGFSWEWFNLAAPGKFTKLQESGELSVAYRQHGESKEIAGIVFDTDVWLRLDESKRLDRITHRILVKKGSALEFPAEQTASRAQAKRGGAACSK